jgi:hypothetical protein
MMSSADYVAQLESVVREQMAEIDQLRAAIGQKDAELDTLVGWIASDAGAHSALQAVYADPRSSPANKVKAAIGAIGFEIAKPTSVTVVIDFKERVHSARMRTLELRKAEWAQLDASLALGSDHEGETLGPDSAA